jgi:LmbE family N-acetylglucosaminyl deacetylase
LLPNLENYNPIAVKTQAPETRRQCAQFARYGGRLAGVVLLALFLSSAQAQAPAGPTDPLPQDSGATGLKQMLLRLRTTARLMQTTAHPDDEDGGVLTLESRGKGVNTLLLTLNRGEGGQNKLGSNLFDVLGVLRTLELTAADRYYGVEQRFTRVADFGFSKNAEETFQKWQGHDIALGDMVRVIRTFRPDVLVARFSGTERDGHGHHQASGIVTKEAFRTAADPKRFPEQIAEGLLPWQAKKLYIGNVCGFMATTCPAENYTVRLNTGGMSPALGMSYIQFAINEGLRHQLSQGAGGWSVEPGDRFSHYKLVDSVLPATADKDGHEQDLFDGIDTSLPALASRLGAEEAKVPWLKASLAKIADNIEQATRASEKDSSRAVEPLSKVLASLRETSDKIDKSSLDRPEKDELLSRLSEKESQAETALNLSLNLSLDATVAPPTGTGAGLPREPEALTVVSPDQKLTVVVKFHNGSKYPLDVQGADLDAPQGWVKFVHAERTTIAPSEDYYANFGVQIPADAPSTRPYWHRANPETESINTVDDERYATLAFPPPILHASVTYRISEREKFLLQAHKVGGLQADGRMSALVVAPFLDDKGAERKRTLAVAPGFSVRLDPGEQVIPVDGGSSTRVTVAVTSNFAGQKQGTIHLEVPSSWRVEPAELPVDFSRRGEGQQFEFKVFPASLKEGKAEIHAVLNSSGKKYSEGYSLVTREDLDAFYYYQPALQRVSIVDVKVPNGLKVGYIMGAGDDIPPVLKQIGMDVDLIPSEKLASVDLGGYGTIVLGIRTYDTQKDVAANNKKLLDYVSAGGTLVVQYETAVSDFNSGHFAPYPARLSRARVSVEEAPIQILAPEDGVFHFPNPITQRDFDGWVQERGLYFMDQWDDQFKPLLACQDPGETLQKGGLLQAKYGKGTYIYTGYAFFRQLPAGVPGAVRLYVNLVSAGHEK